MGKVTVFIRVSCFGRKIVTQFQIPHDRKPYLFKGVDDGPVFQCKKITSASDRGRMKCACLPKRTGDGSGEAARICCPDERRRKDIKRIKCSPCCRDMQDRSKETIRKCGCVVKEERTCSCVQTNVRRLK